MKKVTIQVLDKQAMISALSSQKVEDFSVKTEGELSAFTFKVEPPKLFIIGTEYEAFKNKNACPKP